MAGVRISCPESLTSACGPPCSRAKLQTVGPMRRSRNPAIRTASTCLASMPSPAARAPTLDLKARGSESFETVNVAFLTAPGGGKAEILVDGKSAGQVDLDGPANVRTVLRGSPPDSGDGKFHEVAVRSLSDGPVAVTNIEVARPGDGVSYISFGFPGATVQLLDRLSSRNLADDLSRIAPDVIVLAFGTNEGYDDSLNVAAYIAQYEKIVDRIKQLRPGVRIVMIGPPDGARTGNSIHAVCDGRRRRFVPLSHATEAWCCSRGPAGSRRPHRSQFLGLVLRYASPLWSADLGRRFPAADGP